MKKKIVFMFSGQGSQYMNMGFEFYKNNMVFRYWMDRLDVIFREYTQKSMFDTLYGKNTTRNCTELLYTHLGIFIIEYSLFQALVEEGIEVSCLLGASLGEFAAAVIAKVIKLDDALKLIYDQALCVMNHCEKGRLISIIDDISIYYDNQKIFREAEIGAINYQANFMIAIKENDQNRIEDFLKLKRVSYYVLPVEYAFHSSLIDEAEGEYAKVLSSILLRNIQIPMYSSVTGGSKTDIYPRYFWDAVRKPIFFASAVRSLTRSDEETILLDLGPGGTLATIAKYVLGKNENVKFYSILSPFGNDQKNFDLVCGDLC